MATKQEPPFPEDADTRALCQDCHKDAIIGERANFGFNGPFPPDQCMFSNTERWMWCATKQKITYWLKRNERRNGKRKTP
jgi:hypothetical protein